MKKTGFEYRFTIVYLAIGILWITFSDRLVNSLFSDSELITRIQTYKGLFYVLSTAVLFFYYLRMHLVSLRESRKKAEESDKLKTAFLQNISHEIRTPMNGIMGFAGLLRDVELTEDQRQEYLNIIIRSSNRLLDVVNQVLDISMLETGNIKTNTDEINLKKFTAEILDDFAQDVKPGVDFYFVPDKNLTNETIIISDEYKLRQILNNLINNAIKFTEKGYIKIGYLLNNKKLDFFVEDTGIGIPVDEQQEIFKRFRKSEHTNQRFYDGVGVGLAICKGNLELMNGSISVESDKDNGTRFYFSIPFNPVSAASDVKNEIPLETSNLSGLKILVAEDELLNYSYIEQLLSEHNLTLFHAHNGISAIEICKNTPELDLVLMDIKMPLMNGYDATRAIKKFRPTLPVVAQSAYISSHNKHSEDDKLFNEYLSKPFLKEELIEAIIRNVKTAKS